ncbi:ExbD/TolR family protein [Teredinibacter turnerae]|uniref:ExbD/TolR family protein n=1 Tax=Teredinibacter turnerae TaxID=2426 RepID=UPI0005F7A6FE|nr:biopolymer transporter ExbD [Teredinibacter turnerae]
MRKKSTLDEVCANGIDLNPIMDVVFILLIFFIVTASFAAERTLPVDPLPHPAAGRASKTVVLRVGAQNNITLEGQAVELAGLKARLHRLIAERQEFPSFVLVADERTSVETYVYIMDVVRLVKITRLPIKMEKLASKSVSKVDIKM